MNSIFKIRNKRAQIGATLTWFVAFIIIFFIMTVFVFFSTAAGSKKQATSILSPNGNLENFNEFSSNSRILNSIFSIFESKITLENKQMSILSTILESNEDVLETQVKPIIETKLAGLCEQYYFETPNLLIEKKNLLADFTSVVIIKIPYNSSTIEIKYSQLKTC